MPCEEIEWTLFMLVCDVRAGSLSGQGITVDRKLANGIRRKEMIAKAWLDESVF